MNYKNSRLPPLGRITKRIVEKEIKANNSVVVKKLVDFTEAKKLKDEYGLSYTAIYVKAIAKVIVKYSYANRRIIPTPFLGSLLNRLQNFNNIDIAVAVERLGEGFENVAFIDIVRDAQDAPVKDISTQLLALRNADESNNKQWKDFVAVSKLPFGIGAFLAIMPIYFSKLWVKFRGGACLLSSPGKYGMDTITGSWTGPLGFSYGVIKERALVIDNQCVPRLSCYLTLSFDRRLMGGAQAGKAFNEICELIEDPASLLD